MSEFMLIAPVGWTALDTDYYVSNTEMTVEWVTNVNYTTLVEVATSKLIEHGDMSDTQTLEEIRVIDNTYWVKIVG